MPILRPHFSESATTLVDRVGAACVAVLVQAMLKPAPEARPIARLLGSAPFFDSLVLKALLYMDALPQKPPAEKAQFFRSLPKALPQLPERIVMQKVCVHATRLGACCSGRPTAL